MLDFEYLLHYFKDYSNHGYIKKGFTVYCYLVDIKGAVL